MQLTMTSQHFEITPAIRQFADEKFKKLQRHFDRITSINISFTVEKLIQVVEATIHVPRESLHARAEANDIYSAIDLVIDKLDRQIKKYKEKEDDHR